MTPLTKHELRRRAGVPKWCTWMPGYLRLFLGWLTSPVALLVLIVIEIGKAIKEWVEAVIELPTMIKHQESAVTRYLEQQHDK